jgi:type II secretory pathway predicted ATPase ExeA
VYEAFYGLSEKPFSIVPDPDFLFWAPGHEMAYSMLEYGILNQAGVTVVTGGIGCGKTTWFASCCAISTNMSRSDCSPTRPAGAASC